MVDADLFQQLLADAVPQELPHHHGEHGEKAFPLYYQIDYSLQDNLASVAYWYQTEPHAPFPDLPGPDELRLSVQKAIEETD